MTEKEKQLLLKDLCARSPYGVKVWYPNGSGAISIVKGIVDGVCYFNENPKYGNFCRIETVKPYLRPMSSMTDDERKEWYKESHVDYDCEFQPTPTLALEHCHLSTDWLLSHHFDYRGLIEKGLALEAHEGMYE